MSEGRMGAWRWSATSLGSASRRSRFKEQSDVCVSQGLEYIPEGLMPEQPAALAPISKRQNVAPP